jgi:hypothetical protein
METAMADIRPTRAEVQITTPEGVEINFNTRELAGDLLHVHTHQDMAEPCGTFVLTLSGKRMNGLTYDELLPLRSEVIIRLQDPLDVVDTKASVVMRGLTDDHFLEETFVERVPRRVVTISGRSTASLLLDGRLFYHPLLEHDPSLGTINANEYSYKVFWETRLLGNEIDPRRAIGLILNYYLGLPNTVPVQDPMQPPTAEPFRPARPKQMLMRGLGSESDALDDQDLIEAMRTRNPTLSVAQAAARLAKAKATAAAHGVMSGQQPRVAPGPIHKIAPGSTPAPPAARKAETKALALQSATAPEVKATPAGSATEGPRLGNQLINLQLPGRTVADLLVYREDEATLFEEGVTLSVGQNTAMAGVLWHYLEMCTDTLMQELFTRIEGGTCRLHFRAKPFKKAFGGKGTRFLDDEPTLTTMELPWDQLLQRQQRRQSSNVYNFFIVLPVGGSFMSGHPNYKYQIVPSIARDPDDPSSVQRYGVRLLPHNSPYLPSVQTTPNTTPKMSEEHMIESAKQWAEWASVWYGWGPELYAGLLMLPGSPRYNVGQRLTWTEPRGRREAYCEGVDHDWDARTGFYHTQVRYTRAWYLSGAVDRRTPRGNSSTAT